jgi:photosystem II stability/assembly factor-like uncharacterized protein
MTTITKACRSHRFMLLAVIGMSVALSCATSRWKILTEDSQHPHAVELISVAFTDPNHGWAINAIELWETKDGGTTWSTRLAGNNRYFHSLMFIDQNTGWIVGTKGVGEIRKVLVLRTTDGGQTWLESNVDIITSPYVKGVSGLQSVSFCTPQIGWAVGADLVIHSTDGGQTWEKQRSGSAEVLYGVQCISPLQAWSVGQDGLVLRTENGGKNWFRQDSETTATLTRVRLFDGIGWIVGGLTEKGILLRTSEDGSKWQQVPTSTSETLFDIHMNSQQGWIVGAKGTILHSNDKGQTWDREKSPTHNDLINIFFLNPQLGWISGSKLTLVRLSE